jgi:hypothetical protein
MLARTFGYIVCGAAGIAGVCFSLFIFFSTHQPGESSSPIIPALCMVLSLVALGYFGYLTGGKEARDRDTRQW